MDWRGISINGTNEKFLISVVNESNDNFAFNLTNFKELWREKIAWQEILRRAKSQNSFMDVAGQESAVERTIFSQANHYEYTTDGNDLQLKTKYYIGGLPFHFQWNLTKSSADGFYDEITRKLLVSLLNVQDQRNELIEIVKRKDAEISQYKIEGATLLRKQIATEPFLQSDFNCKFELVSNAASTFAGTDDNCNAIRQMCNYNDLIKDHRTNTLNVTEGPSPSKISKAHNNKEENAMRKFKAKKECKIQYESSCELLISDGEMEQPDTNVTLDGADVQANQANGNTDRTTDQSKVVPKRKLRSKLNL